MSIAAYEQKIRELQHALAALGGRHTELLQQTGRLLAVQEAFREVQGWDRANEICRELEAIMARIETVETYQKRYQQDAMDLEHVERHLKQLEQRHRVVLTEIGSLAYQQYKVGSARLSQHAAAFAELESLEEKIQQRERRLAETRQSSDEGWIGRLKLGTSGLVNRFQNLLEEGRRKSLYHELGNEMVRVGLAQTILARQDPTVFAKFLEDLDGWEEAFRQRDRLRQSLEDIKAHPTDTGYPFAATLRDLHRLQAQIEEKSRAIFGNLYQRWKDGGYQPAAQGQIEEFRRQIEDIEGDLQRYRSDLEKAEWGLRGARLLEEAHRNRARGQKLIDEGNALIQKALAQETEGRALLEKAEA